MKNLFAILALVTLPVLSGTIATAENKSGGLLVLTDLGCAQNKNLLVAYTTNETGKTMFGCWFLDDNFVMVAWDDGEVTSYPHGIWKMKKSKKTF